MQAIQAMVDGVYERRIQEEFDAVIPVVGDEGVGKSTLILQLGLLYQDARDGERDKEALLDSLVYTREGVQKAFANWDRRSLIAIPDAARTLHKKEAMAGEQVELEKDFFDVRTMEFFILLGYQEWQSIPSFMINRRAQALLRITERGTVHLYNRDSIDRLAETEEWPDPDFRESFPSLEGTDFWAEYKEYDREAKAERMGPDEKTDPKDVRRDSQTRVAIRAWARGMTYEEVETIVDYSDGWVGERIREWKDGQHRTLFEDETEVETLERRSETRERMT